MIVEYVWGVCGFGVGTTLATICMIAAAAFDDKANQRRGDEEQWRNN